MVSWAFHHCFIMIQVFFFTASTVKPVNSNPVEWERPVKLGLLVWSQTVVLSANCTLDWGHPWIKDTFGFSQGFPYVTGFVSCHCCISGSRYISEWCLQLSLPVVNVTHVLSLSVVDLWPSGEAQYSWVCTRL
jgi:hypothetical protein